MEEEIKQNVGEKKSKWLLWLIIALIVIGVGVGIYFLVSGGGIGGSEIMSPPALPE
ncbi:MAG: hypothetical protein KKF56_02860 [Nanoarchaeota archaeon]|nr:hypothetical protein [Nanoarchaeota archaeon]